MVHPKAGNYGAVAQNVRKKAKEASTMGKAPSTKKAQPTTTNEKKKEGTSKSKEKGPTPAEMRNANEMALLAQALKDGTDPNNIDIGKLDRALDKMEQDEKSGEEYSDDKDKLVAQKPKTESQIKKEVKKKNRQLDNQPITDRKLLQKYKVDREDYKLQYAYVDEKPVYHELYQKLHYSFFELYKGPPDSNLKLVSDRLLILSNEIMSRMMPQKPDQFPETILMTRDFRQTAKHTNVCINPLQILRAWSMLLGTAQNKTRDDLCTFLNHHIKRSFVTNDQFYSELTALHMDVEELFDGCVRMFAEFPRHLPDVGILRRQCNAHFGGKSQRAAIQHHCFATDSDGFYSCYRINEEMAVSTRGSVRYVVPESCAPNWRASVALASAIDCTFYWKTTDPKPIETPIFRFNGGEKVGVSKCSGILARANVRTRDGMYRLEGHQEGVYLFIIPEDPKEVEKDKEINIEKILPKLRDSDGWTAREDHKVFIPKCTTSTPLSLYDHAKHKGLARLFSSEKSELRLMKESIYDSSGSPQFTTVYDHYHKTVFEICTAKPNSQEIERKFDDLAPERAHQCMDEAMAKNFSKFQINESRLYECLFTYYEDHLDMNTRVFDSISKGFNFNQQENDVKFDSPFYYIMTRNFINEPFFVVCAGYFNNTVWVIRE